MHTLLQSIVEKTRESLSEVQRRRPESELRRAALSCPPTRGFLSALRHQGPPSTRIIAEIKRASPSKGILNPHLDPMLHARLYEDAGAAALSVLTEPSFFDGHHRDLHEARKATSLPVLRKDFILSLYQIFESRVLGADAILLITSILSRSFLKEAVALATELGLDTLVEVHEASELSAALESGTTLLGINNRDLHTFETDITNTVKLAPHIPAHVTLVSESGIASRRDILTLKTHGVRSFLIGEALLRSTDPRAKLQSLLD